MLVLLAAAALLSGVHAAPAEIPGGAGWSVGATRITHAGCSRCVQTESWAATIPYADTPDQIPPWRTLARLGRHDLIVHITRAWEPAPPRWVHRRRPLNVLPGEVHANFEGNAGQRVSLWSGSTWRAGSYVTAWVFFGSPTPPQGDLRRAQRQLDGAQFPIWRIGR